jgi:hypothetical protein
MPATLSILRTVGLFVFGIALSAVLHGMFSAQPSGFWFMPIVFAIVVFACFALPVEMQFYGFLTAAAIVLGVIVWSK